jgi:hypothetical protein
MRWVSRSLSSGAHSRDPLALPILPLSRPGEPRFSHATPVIDRDMARRGLAESFPMLRAPADGDHRFPVMCDEFRRLRNAEFVNAKFSKMQVRQAKYAVASGA